MDTISILQKKLADQNLDALLLAGATNIRYLSGYRGEEAWLLLTAKGEGYFITDFRYLEQAEQEWQESGGAFPMHFLEQNLQKPLAAVLGGLFADLALRRVGFEGAQFRYDVYKSIQDKAGATELLAVADLLADLRSVKSERELAHLRKAAQIADAAFTALLAELRPGLTERMVAARFDYLLYSYGAEGPAFNNIVASGKNGSLCHAIPSNKVLEEGEFITFDFGAVWQGYHSDCTRTICLGQASRKQRELYDLVLQAQLAAEAALRPGIEAKAVDKIARDMIAQAGYGAQFGHGLGHGIGLDVHEEPRLTSSSSAILQAGHVVTVEPGVYIPGWGGLRIEDSLIITESGSEIITHCPKELICL